MPTGNPDKADIDSDFRAYYAERAREYESIYAKPERQEDLTRIASLLPAWFAERDVLEVAAGTGYWTERIAPAARSIVATDINAETLDVARAKGMSPERVALVVADAFALDVIPGAFDAGFAGFWWSHLARVDLVRFLDGFHRRLGPGARVAFLDNRYVEGSSTPVAWRDADGNTYQDRRLRDGSIHRVRKNFPTPDAIRAALGPAATETTVLELPYYWLATYTVA